MHTILFTILISVVIAPDIVNMQPPKILPNEQTELRKIPKV